MSYRKNKSAYPALEAEIAFRQIRKKDIAESVNITPRAMSLKLVGKSNFTLNEALVIHQQFFKDVDFVTLFKRNERS